MLYYYFCIAKFFLMASDSKLRFFLIFVLPVIFLNSCKKERNDVIPDVYVNFTLDLYDPEFVNLNAMGGSDTVDARTNNWGSGAAGYNGNGIIIYRGADEFYAYDRTCPYDYAVNGLSIKIKIDFTLAVCPKCGTSYALSAFGTPTSGIGRYPLKNYRTSFDGRYVRAWNSY
jgi:nitrite reductase/ring-hydroxylating ferredoxin subunit